MQFQCNANYVNYMPRLTSTYSAESKISRSLNTIFSLYGDVLNKDFTVKWQRLPRIHNLCRKPVWNASDLRVFLCHVLYWYNEPSAALCAGTAQQACQRLLAAYSGDCLLSIGCRTNRRYDWRNDRPTADFRYTGWRNTRSWSIFKDRSIKHFFWKWKVLLSLLSLGPQELNRTTSACCYRYNAINCNVRHKF